jgi:hypothetical protein
MSEGKNSVFVELYDLKLSERPDDRFGRVIITKSLNEEDLINIAVKQGTDLNAATLRAAIDILKSIAFTEIANGASVEFGPAIFYLAVKGVFIGNRASWDPVVNSLQMKAISNTEFRAILKNIHVSMQGMANSGTVINTLIDMASGEENKRLTPGGAVNLTGLKIRIAGDDSTNGLALINQSSGETYDIPMTSVPVNTPKKVSFIVPSHLPPGGYKLRITTQYTTGKNLLKEPRTYLFNQALEMLPVACAPAT